MASKSDSPIRTSQSAWKRIARSIARLVRTAGRYNARIRCFVRQWELNECGYRCGLEPGVRFLGETSVQLGNRVTLRRGVTIGGGGRLKIGSNTTINENTIIGSTDQIDIGNDCLIAAYVYILDVDHRFDRLDVPIREQGYRHAPIAIGNDVWIGTHTIILKGVTIGDGAVIAANSVVSKDIPPMTIAAGSPAQVIRSRTPESVDLPDP